MGAVGTKKEDESGAAPRLTPLGFAHADDADLLIVDHSSDGARVWNIGTGKETARFRVSGWTAVPSPDGKLLAAEEHGEVVLLDTATGREVKRMLVDPEEKARKSYRNGVRLAWSADGRTLAATLREDHVCILDPATGKERARFPLYPADAPKKLGLDFIGRPYSAWGLAVSPDGKRLAASVIHGLYVAVWDAETGALIAPLDHGFQVTSVVFTPDGKAVITFGSTGLGYRWDVEKLIAAQKK
jgi:WD40 repeat protein